MPSLVSNLQTRKNMKQIIDSRIGLLVLLLSCFLCGNSLPVPAARVHTSAARSAAQQEELQNDNSEHKRVRSEPEPLGEFRTTVYEGDIRLLEPRQHSGQSKRAVTSFATLRWENATVPYKFDMNFTTSAKRKVLRAINHWHKNTCIRFVPRSDESEYIKFVMGPICTSYIGRIPRIVFSNYDGQTVSLTKECVKDRGKIIHELGHVIGFWHEHTRPDRDDHIEILWENIRRSRVRDFDKRPPSHIDSLGVPYDLGSIMQYPLDAFSKNEEPTIRVLDTNFTGVVGQRDGLSQYDSRQANLFYACDIGELAINNGAVTEGLDVIRTGQEIALKVESEGSNRHLWMNCSHSGCRLDGCPGNRFKPEKHDVCTDHVYTLLKLDCSNGKQAMVGDEVVLRKHLQGSAETVYCGLSGQCRATTECDVDGQFDREACLDQILLLKVPEKENGSFLLHKDELTLRYAYRDGRLDESERGSWLDCDDGGERVCKRSDCPLGPNETGGVNGASHLVEKCQQDRFVVYKL